MIGPSDASERADIVDLAASRAKIDRIDTEIVTLFEERMRVACDVARYKHVTGTAILDVSREAAVIERAEKQASEDFRRFIAPLFNLLMEMSRSYQQDMIDSEPDSLFSVPRKPSVEFEERNHHGHAE